jgi:hypothetical protein
MREIALTKGYVAFVDDDDHELLGQFRWRALVRSHTVYVQREVRRSDGKWTSEMMHRRIMGLVPGDGIQVDHINHNGLDNRRANLRLATRFDNQHNRVLAKTNTSGFLGVTWARREGKWQAMVKANGRNYWGGYHDTPEEAARVRDELAAELHGEFFVPALVGGRR